jgi:outer membrane biogenesis lipoprotein LolB
MKLNPHARIEIAAIAVLLLCSCTLDDNQRDEVEDIAYDTVLEHDTVIDLQNRVSEIELRLNM